MITFFQAIVIGLLQGVTELFPISSLGHSVLLADLFGWNDILVSEAQGESFFLAFLVALHMATAAALLIFYRQEWGRIISGFCSSVAKRKATTSYERMAWLIIIATIPAGLLGLLLEHLLRTQFAKPLAAAVFLLVNGCILLAGDRLKTKAMARKNYSLETTTENTANTVTVKRAGIIGVTQSLALFAGISRSGITMVSGLMSGLDYEDSARFSFLLATPLILAAGLYKLPDLFGQLGDGARMQILAGSIAAGLAAYLTVRFLDNYFQNQRLRPFAVYCLAFGAFMLILQLI